MSARIACPECGETDALRGEREGTIIWITCGRCLHRWPRDPDVCPRCRARTMGDRREPLYQKARGTQQSIIGYRVVPMCSRCGYEAW
jgi:ribosomal protein L37AE/L43A